MCRRKHRLLAWIGLVPAMPLSILWGSSAFQLMHQKVGWKIVTIWTCSAIALVVTTAAVIYWLYESTRLTRKQLQRQVSLNMELRLARTICYFPFQICALAFATLVFPSTAYSLEMVMAIAASVVMGCLVQYYLQALGGGIKGNLSKTLLQKTPEMKWWMPSYLGGVNDMLPGMGFVYSRQPHSLALSDIHRATNLVEMFMWIYMITTAVQVGFSVFPMPVYQNKDGWCVQDEAMSSGLSTTILILQILSTFIGSAGFSIISSAAHHVYQELDPDNEFHFKRKGSVGSLYLQLPLLKVIIGLLPIQTKKVSIPVSVQTSETPLGGGNFTTSWTTLSCPVFDKSVCTPMIFCGVVTIFMAYLAVVQMRIYSPDEVFDEYLESVKSKLVEPPSESSSDEVELCA